MVYIKVENIPKSLYKESNALVKLTTCGNVIEKLSMTKVNRKGSQIVYVDKDHYFLKEDIDSDTGEILGELKKFNRTENRGQNIKGIRSSMKKLRDLINCNVTNVHFCRWLTLTYAENMTDSKRLYVDFKNFVKRLKYHHEKNGLPNFEYIVAVEPQGRGAWHLHCIFIYESKAPYLPNDLIRDIWSFGFVTVKKLDNVDNVGAYLTAYMCDVDFDELSSCDNISVKDYDIKTKEIDIDGEKVTKKYIKGARLYMYPNKMNFYRCSRGVKKPDVEWVSKKEAEKKVRGATLTYQKSIRLTDDETGFTNDLCYEYYNTIRGKNQ